MKKSMIVKCEVEVVKNEPQFIQANVTVDYSVDKNYGADADGNRGIEKLFINDVVIHSILDCDGVEIIIPEDRREDIEDAIWSWVWENIEV